MDVLFGALLGISTGFRHAFEPDHLAAVSTLVTERRSPRSGLVYATLWGLGHACMLLLFGGALFMFRRELSPTWDARLETCVGLVLVALGIRALFIFRKARTAARGQTNHAGPSRQVDHDCHTGHDLFDAAEVRESDSQRIAFRSLAVGLVHGLAGSGALTALLVAKRWESAKGLLFIGLFGLGATVGMAALGGLFGYALFRVARSRNAFPFVSLSAGMLSLVMGVVWIGKHLQ